MSKLGKSFRELEMTETSEWEAEKPDEDQSINQRRRWLDEYRTYGEVREKLTLKSLIPVIMYCGDTAEYCVNALTDWENQNIELKSELETLREGYAKFKLSVTDAIAELKAVVSAVKSTLESQPVTILPSTPGSLNAQRSTYAAVSKKTLKAK